MDSKDIAAFRAMTPQQRLRRACAFTEQAWQFKTASVRAHHPGWSEEQVMAEVRRWVNGGMNPAELYEWSL